MREVEAKHVRVLVVDDLAPFRAAAGALVDAADGFELAGTAASGNEALLTSASVDIDFAIIDLDMPGLDGFETAQALRQRNPNLLAVVVSAQPPLRWKGAAPPSLVIAKEQLSIGWLAQVWRDHVAALG